MCQSNSRLNRAQNEATDLEANMEKFQREIESEVAAVLARTPFQIFGPKTPVAVDSESSEDIDLMKSLPPPLVPQSVLPVFDVTESSPGTICHSATRFHSHRGTVLWPIHCLALKKAIIIYGCIRISWFQVEVTRKISYCLTH